ncbi:DUF2254 domain-containing protein [Microbulbifer rhizosphaerae]|uniref:Putative membrane protein n=1 Tax=Microbulbifer rhizosphaerae TaxID=1562603 RepID=A0A7W4W9H7_9GAMM|nr:DUF2254 domain-containing protein [Microbulbifer rhizosphaerae]MBB3059511.1 putative membrane protein [Microbulbifer rhizosphaerae]
MRQYLQHLGERLRSSFWLVPAVMAVAAIALSQGMQLVDQVAGPAGLPGMSWMRLQDPDSARSLLAMIAGSTITVAGTVFSITTVALTLASNQFGPRLVRNFMRDRGTQCVLGIFLSTFVYALVTMRGIDAQSDAATNHGLAVHTAVLLAVVSIAFLIYFIHNVAQSIQVDNVTFHINRELSDAIDRLYPSAHHHFGEGAERCDTDRLPLGEDRLSIFCEKSGYIQIINREKLIRWASEHDCCIRLECHPGSYLNSWTPVASVFQPPRHLDSETISKSVAGAIGTGHQPTAEQDIVFSIHQLAQIAVRALSPGINDPYTAYACINRLVDGIGKVLQRPQLPNCFRDDDGNLRLVTLQLDFADLLQAAFDEIREYGRQSGVVMRHLVDALLGLTEVCTRTEDRHALRRYTDRLEEDLEKFIDDRFDREIIQKKISGIRQWINLP